MGIFADAEEFQQANTKDRRVGLLLRTLFNIGLLVRRETET
jgi:hypothetical protein